MDEDAAADHARMRRMTSELLRARPPTFILSQRMSSDSQDVWGAVVKRGWNVHRAIRFRPPEDAVLCCVYGELLVCDIMAARAGLSLLDPPDNFLPSLPKEFLKRDVVLTTVGGLHDFKDRAFFKPANDKVFTAGVYERGADVPVRYLDPSCPVLVSEVVAFATEFRCHVLDGSVVSMDHYRLTGSPEEVAGDPDAYEDRCRSAARDFAELVLKSWSHGLPSAVVLDVGCLEGRGMAVVEANQAYSSGLYGGVNDKILDVILRSSGPENLVSSRDTAFVRPRIEVSGGVE